jgi:thiamine biosynthesis lipoprotein
MRQVEQIMGMPITVDIPGCDIGQVFKNTYGRLREIDKSFSPYKKNSELSKYQRGELDNDDLSAEFKKIMSACKAAEEQTDGYFSAYFSGVYDPTGYVKGWAIAEAGKIISAGGDILARSDSDKVWNIGIQDPKNKQGIVNKLSIKNGAVATSGNYERGGHIINPKTGKHAGTYLSLSVTGADIIKSDVLATACFAAGNIDLINKFKGYKALVY